MKYWKTFGLVGTSLEEYIVEKGESVRTLKPVFQTMYPDFYTEEITKEEYDEEMARIERDLNSYPTAKKDTSDAD